MFNLMDNPDYGRLREEVNSEINTRIERLLNAEEISFEKERGFIQGMRYVNDYLSNREGRE